MGCRMPAVDVHRKRVVPTWVNNPAVTTTPRCTKVNVSSINVCNNFILASSFLLVLIDQFYNNLYYFGNIKANRLLYVELNRMKVSYAY